MLQSTCRWQLKHADEKKIQTLADALGISALTARLLVIRGIEEPDAADVFLNQDKASFHDPMDMLGMQETVARIKYAVAEHEKIRVFGDYDADGVTSTALLVRALTAFGADVSYYIPNRFTEGYGPNVPAVQQAKEDGIHLIITVDSGIAAYDAAECAGRIGIDYIITDHHEVPDPLPEAFAIVNPKQNECAYPFKGLSGAGVALKLVQALFPEGANRDWIALAMIGTIADLVPLLDENRLIAQLGLETIRSHSLAGIDALKKKAGYQGPADSETVGFQLGPRLNAAGRMDDADPAVRLLLSDNPEESMKLAEELDRLNLARKSLVETLTQSADEQAAVFHAQGKSAFVIEGENWHQGVIGIVASRIVEKYYRPTIILSIDTETGLAKGSGRSIQGFDIYQGLTAARTHLIQFGGHQMAAGLSLHAESISDFRDAFNQAAEQSLNEEALTPTEYIDGFSTPNQMTLEQIEEFARLAPFGTENPRPLFKMNDLSLTKMSAVGREGSHLKVSFKGQDKDVDGIGFRLGALTHHISPIDRVNVIGEWGINEWNGFRKPQFVIKDLSVSGLQIFDWRADRNILERLRELPENQVELLAFRRETTERMPDYSVHLYEPNLVIKKPYLVLLDLPGEEKQLVNLLSGNSNINRIYTVFHHEDEHYFSSFPTRDHFKWYYALIRQEHSFQLSVTMKKIARYKGWSETSVKFMTKVFFELGFVRIKGDILTENRAPEKRPLTDSQAYRETKNQLELEDLFCYSSLSTLKEWFDRHIENRNQAMEPEGTAHGL